MRLFSKTPLNSFNRSAVFGLAAAGLFSVCPEGFAQRASGEIVRPGMERIDQEEGERRLRDFRRQRLQGDYVFEFQLEHKPRRARTVRYDGVMWGSWNERGPITRFKIHPASDGRGSPEEKTVELIVQNGFEPEAWIRREEHLPFEKIVGDALFQPVLPGLLYSVFDLQMPFIYWQDFTYEGPSLIGASRVGQRFLMQPPEGFHFPNGPIQGVRISLDDTYNALWRVEIINEDETIRSRFAVESFKKIDEQYIVKRITLTDYTSRDRTTFDVEDAHVGLHLDPALFQWTAAPSVGPTELIPRPAGD
jgi:hypothetical protein